MLFLGFLKVGKSVGSFALRAAALEDTKRNLHDDINDALEARQTVIATVGEEIKALAAIKAKL